MANIGAKIFGTRKKGPSDLIKGTKKYLGELGSADSKDEKSLKKITEKLSSYLSGVKFMLYGDGDNQPKKENIAILTDQLFAGELLLELLKKIKGLEFEARKDVAQIYNFVLRNRNAEAVAYVQNHPEILSTLVNGYDDSEIALNCGSILREVIRSEKLNLMLLNDDKLFKSFFDYVQRSTFDVASDAFATFKLMLTKHGAVCAEFLDKNFDAVFEEYNMLLMSRNYVTKRQSLKLLGELLLNRTNFSIMMRYINSADNLKIMMNLLRGQTKAIQFEAFHVFKIFVANPKKQKPVIEILLRNRERLIEFLQRFQKDKEDEQFNDEKQILLSTLQDLKQPDE